MSYTETGITVLSLAEYDGGMLLRVANATTADLLQCYVNGKLLAWQTVHEDTWTVDLSGVADTDLIFVLAVDSSNAETDYWDDAYPTSTVQNRLKVRIAQKIVPYLPGDRWRVYRGDAGDESAALQVYEADIYPGGRRACGFGSYWGENWGWDGHECKGYGYNFGYGEFGFDCEMFSWTSDPMARGTYPVKVSIIDAAGNESTATTGSIALAAYARPASSLAVSSYAKATDALAFTYTQSEDITA